MTLSPFLIAFKTFGGFNKRPASRWSLVILILCFVVDLVSNDLRLIGVVLINKEKHFVAALTVCLFNAKEEREVIYRITYGDKESFWLGFEFVGDSFHLRPFPPKSLGIRSSKDKDDVPSTICNTHILHSDINNEELMWLNGGIQIDKSSAVWF